MGFGYWKTQPGYFLHRSWRAEEYWMPFLGDWQRASSQRQNWNWGIQISNTALLDWKFWYSLYFQMFVSYIYILISSIAVHFTLKKSSLVCVLFYVVIDIFFEVFLNSNLHKFICYWLASSKNMQVYFDMMRSFRTEFDDLFAEGLISAVEVGLGASGELKYPSFSERMGWRYPGIGEFQVPYCCPVVKMLHY